MKSHSKPSKDIFLAPCPQRPARLYPQEQAPQQWRSCGDSYEHTWMADYGRNIVALRLRDRQKLARSMGYCPHSRCQLDNLTAHSGSSSSGAGAGSCPAGLCYTKVESGALSFGACCYDSSGIFNSGELFGVYNRTQTTPKPIYKHSRVVLGHRLSGATDFSATSFVNANEIHPFLLAAQCPLAAVLNSLSGAEDGTPTDTFILDTLRMIIERNVTKWLQLAPQCPEGEDPLSAGARPLGQPGSLAGSCAVLPLLLFGGAGETAAYARARSYLSDFELHGRGQAPMVNVSYTVHAYTRSRGPLLDTLFDAPIIDDGRGSYRAAAVRVNHLWYLGWRDFDVPSPVDDGLMRRVAAELADTIRREETAVVSCLSGRGRSGTMSAAVVGLSSGVRSLRQLADVVVALREGRDGLVETPQHFRYAARLLGLDSARQGCCGPALDAWLEGSGALLLLSNAATLLLALLACRVLGRRKVKTQ